MTDQDRAHMTHALALGRRGLGQCWPNPAVGCVIVRDGRVLGRGRTASGGRPHAEPQALAQAGQAARGATAYVTLEPCAHHGQTPPCAQTLVDAGIGRVVTALEDPDPRVAGRGHAMLRAAGVTVEAGLMADQARQDLAGFLTRTTQGRPMVTLKLASSFDGRIATATGESRWITGPEARAHVHALRAGHDAVLIGAGTARADDPMLDVRGQGARPNPVRVVLSRKLDVPRDGKLFATAHEQPVWLIHGADASDEARQSWEQAGARLIECPAQGRQVDLPSALRALGAAGLTRVFCEGGGTLASALIGAGLVDRLVGMTAGLALGAEGVPALGAMGLDRLAEAPRFRLMGTRPIGADLLHEWVPQGAL